MTKNQNFTPANIDDAQKMSASEAIEYHYDNDTAFFSLWLDKSLSYSSGRWHDPLSRAPIAEDLAQSQVAKLAFHLDGARVSDGHAILDIGCGWGAILKGAVTERGATSALGLTLSRDQNDHILAQGWPGVSVMLQDFFAFDTEMRFDGAISIGAFEHFARPEMDRMQKIAVYRNFFDRLHTVLKPGAAFSLQTIVWDAVNFEESKAWLPQTVFPQSDIPFISEVVEGAAPTFRLAYLENDPQDYALTLQAWIANLRAHRETIVARWGEEKFTWFEHYLRNSRLAFTRRKNSLARFIFLRR
ncbi:class I SAM-dependent methyltransferase [Acuticoccus kandeliae]|uniref:class I SAM-dependent methyltransferase n=1 Tax=Acuticoccus kandeliae TaxID=2073160 RepID=UPI000D3E10E8|nr:class I SAM-dependent methyltransferase [Acuticoccus kandeliae]